ncbi:MAG TPA: Mur ligase family protein [Victivallales bacterium]|nr:Mur ligase family protein [Victivallales bacterium]HRR06100.1 Mur ligase family protein [Victivallales bacterium]HRR28647.1 Mur ligase family protein [Victivallales bacterium]
MKKIKSYQDALNFLSKLEFFGMKMGLEQTQMLANFANNPQKTLKFIHIAGTNGKGTIAAMMATALTSAGLKTGLYTSPHLISPRERFKVDGKSISEDDFVIFSEEIRKIYLKALNNGMKPTYFETTTVMALLYFKEKKVDIIVWECGLGGRLDATNIVTPEISVITSIAKDHCIQLGNTFAKIAREKAGIIKKNIPCFCGKNIPNSARIAIIETAKSFNNPLFFSDGKAKLLSKGAFYINCFIPQKFKYDGYIVETSFPGIHQNMNITLTCDCIKYLSAKLGFSYEKSLKGISNASLPARMSIMPDSNLVDGGHNPQAINLIVKNILYYFGKEKFVVIFGGLKDKDIRSNIQKLLRISQKFLFVEVKGARKAYSTGELMHIFNDFNTNIPAKPSNLKESLKEAGRKIVVGSFYLAGETMKEYFLEENIINWGLK